MLQGSSVRDLQRCFEFRLLIESEAAYFAAQRHNPASLKRISECVYPPTYDFPAVSQQPLEAFDFHQAVVAAADNPFLEKSMEMIISQPGFQVYLRLCSATKAPDPVAHRTQDQRRASRDSAPDRTPAGRRCARVHALPYPERLRVHDQPHSRDG